MLEKVIKNQKIPKTNKIKLLAGRDVLNGISELFEWNGPLDVVSDGRLQTSFVQ